MARSYLIAGNWKMHLNAEEARALVKALKAHTPKLPPGVEVLVCPAFTSLEAALEEAKGSPIQVGAQNMYWQEQGAFTGEVSPLMLKSVGVSHVLLGHSERRHVFMEPDDLIQKKVAACFKHGLKPVLCIGETLDERNAGKTLEVLDRQLHTGLAGLKPEDVPLLTVAYEPVWAIGTGVNATPQQAQEAHAHARKRLGELLGAAGLQVKILYGGSVKDDNAKVLLSEKDVDGALVGGAALKAPSFCGIMDAAIALSQ